MARNKDEQKFDELVSKLSFYKYGEFLIWQTDSVWQYVVSRNLELTDINFSVDVKFVKTLN